MPRVRTAVACLVVASAITVGCTYHPPGEREERARARAAGAPFIAPPECRVAFALPASPTPDDLVRHALLASPEIEAAYWRWQAALERVPQAGTPQTTLAVFGSHAVKGEGSAWNRTTLGLQNDPMFNLPPPSRLSARARRALEEARAEGHRFEQAKWDLRRRVLEAYYDYALLAETARIADLDVGQWDLTVTSVEGRVEAGAVAQHGLLAARTSLDLARSDVATLRSRIPARLAALNALLGRPPAAPLALPDSLPQARSLVGTDDEVLRLAAGRNPGLGALSAEAAGAAAGIREARTGYLPEISLSGSVTGDLMRTIGGMVTLPFVRREALAAAVAEARADLRETQARRRQAENDLGARVVLDLSSIRDTERRIELFRSLIVPRAEQAVELSRTGYSVDRSTYLDIRDAQRTLLDARRTLAELRVEREKVLADLEASVGAHLRRSGGGGGPHARSATATTRPDR